VLSLAIPCVRIIDFLKPIESTADNSFEFCEGAQTHDVNIRYETMMLFNALSVNDGNKIDISENDQHMQSLCNVLTIMEESNVRCTRQAISCLANLSELTETHVFLRRHFIHQIILGSISITRTFLSGVFLPLIFVDHFEATDVALLREAARLLTNLASIQSNHNAIITTGGIFALLKGLLLAIFIFLVIMIMGCVHRLSERRCDNGSFVHFGSS
jgi:hypothetical protein